MSNEARLAFYTAVHGNEYSLILNRKATQYRESQDTGSHSLIVLDIMGVTDYLTAQRAVPRPITNP